jgi:hypothetical protein
VIPNLDEYILWDRWDAAITEAGIKPSFHGDGDRPWWK